MVEERLKLEPEVQEIFRIIDSNANFLLNGGAGSGKTYSLVQTIIQAILENPTSKIACMTYTNAAVKEIEDRVNHKNLNVTTIHDFLWDNIKHFQKELKEALVSLNNNINVTKISIDDTNSISINFFTTIDIQYKEYVKLKEGKISHDEVLIVANYLFEKYPRLCDIVKDKYRFMFIDEYQDTNELVIEIFLKHFKQGVKKNIIGFFGDAMQSIYDDGIGNLDAYTSKGTGEVIEVKKSQNRRNPQSIIHLANILRTDNIKQIPSNDLKAPNMFEGKIIEGNAIFLYSKTKSVDEIKIFLMENYNWDFLDVKNTKELNLTHNLIADKAEFRSLMDIYDSDPVIGIKDAILKKIKDNKKANKPEIEIEEHDTFDQVLDKFKLVNQKKELKKDILLNDTDSAELYAKLKDKPFSEVRRIYLNKDSLIDDKKQHEKDLNKKGSKRDNLIKHLFKIQKNITYYSTENYNDFLRSTDYRNKIIRIKDKQILKENIESLINVGDKTIEDIINDAHQKGIVLIDEKLEKFKIQNEYLFDRVKKVKFLEFQKLFKYLEGKTPFSTQHKTKGAEFKNVLVILDNGGWNSYNFENLFLSNGTTSVLERTQKIFYVCCTRAKENLAVFYQSPQQQVVDEAIKWFGERSVINLDK